MKTWYDFACFVLAYHKNTPLSAAEVGDFYTKHTQFIKDKCRFKPDFDYSSKDITQIINGDLGKREKNLIDCDKEQHPRRFSLPKKVYGKAKEEYHDLIEELRSSDSTDVATEKRAPMIWHDKPASAKDTKQKQPQAEGTNPWAERDLHPLLAYFIYNHRHFQKALSVTIDHLKAKKGVAGAKHWTYPDMVAINMRYRYEDLISGFIQNRFAVTSYTLFSFEIKKELTQNNLRECYIQAFTNSSWANEGYLVAAELGGTEEFNQELQLLHNSFGIGVIQIGLPDEKDDNVSAERFMEKSKILYPARYGADIDWNTVDKLCKNEDFKNFIKNVTEIKPGASLEKNAELNKEKNKIQAKDKLEKYLRENFLNKAPEK